MKILIVNGVSGCGKDTLIDGLHGFKKLSVIEPIKQRIEPLIGGLARGSKTEAADRKLLSDVYESIMKNHPLVIMDWLIQNVYRPGFDRVAIIARQPRDINRIKNLFEMAGHEVYTVYISRPGLCNRFDNDGDNTTNPTAMNYDLYFDNDVDDVEGAIEAFRVFISAHIG